MHFFDCLAMPRPIQQELVTDNTLSFYFDKVSDGAGLQQGPAPEMMSLESH